MVGRNFSKIIQRYNKDSSQKQEHSIVFEIFEISTSCKSINSLTFFYTRLPFKAIIQTMKTQPNAAPDQCLHCLLTEISMGNENIH